MPEGLTTSINDDVIPSPIAVEEGHLRSTVRQRKNSAFIHHIVLFRLSTD
jgi:hypothetical protein